MINKVKLLSIMLFLAGFIVLSCDNSCCAEEAPEPENKVTLSGIDVASKPTKMLYVAGEKFEPSGMVVNATYSDNSTKELKDGEYTYSPTGTLTENNTNITISYTDGGITRETVYPIKMGYKITVAECENGTVECDLTRAEGKRKDGVPVKVTPDKGYYLTSLSYKYNDSKNEPNIFNIPVKENKNEYSFDMPFYDITIEAVFAEDPTPRYSIELNKIGEKDQAKVTFIYGDEDSEDIVHKNILEDTKISFTVAPNSGDYYLPEIPKISYNGNEYDVDVVDSAEGKYEFTMPGANVVVNVVIAKWGTYKLSTNIVDGKGSVDLKVNNEAISHETYLNVGDEIVATITPADDFELSYAQFNDEKIYFDDLDENNQYTFIMEDKASSLEVVFTEKKGFDVVRGVIKNGTLQISHTLAKEGTTVMITATPDEGYADVDVITVKTAGGTKIPVNKSETGKYNFVMPKDDVTVGCVFRGYKITINSNEYGTVDAVKTAKSGEEIILTANATEKNALGTICIKAGEDYLKNTRTDIESGKAKITFTMPASDVEIDAVFGKAVIVTADYTPEKAGLIELYQGKTYVTLGNTMYFAEGTELTLETTPGTIGDGIYEVGAVKAIAANDQSSLNLVTEVTANEEYKIVVEDRNFEILVEFSVSNAKRVFINKEGLAGGTIVVEESGKIVTSSSDSWLDGDAYIIEGHTVTVRATADVGYTEGTIKWNGKTIANGGEFSMPAEQVEITATFKKDSYPLNFNSSVDNGSFTISSDFTFNETTKVLSAAGTTYKTGDKVPYKEKVYIIATPSNTSTTTYMEQITVMNDTEGQAISPNRNDLISEPYYFEMPASSKGVTITVNFEFASSDVWLFVNEKEEASFYLNPTPDKETWGTLKKEYYIRYQNAEGHWCQGYPLKKGDRVQFKKKNGANWETLDHWEGMLGFDEKNNNYNVNTKTYTAEEDGIYKMYYKIWNEYDDNKIYIGEGYSQWIEIPRVQALVNADYFLEVNGKDSQKFEVSVSIDNKKYPTLVKQYYLKNVSLQKGDSVRIETTATIVPKDGILWWEKENTVGADGGSPFKVQTSGEYDFYFKVWQDGGTSIWVQKSAVASN
ncbi:MAG: hypothetical protein J6B11_08080 [Spirochaetales bacterium]|nr:hypothetical protein [Spirochaetales bacterium]